MNTASYPTFKLHSRGWIVAAVLGACSAQASATEAQAASDRAAYAAVCSFLGDEIERLDILVAKRDRDALLRTDRESGARLYRRQGQGMRIEYVVTAGGKTMISRAELGPGYFGKRLSAASLQEALRLPHALPPTLQTGCDRYALTVKRNGAHIAAMTIDVDID